MPGPAEYSYHGETLIGRRQFAERVGLSEPKLKQIINGRPREVWTDLIDDYLRLLGRGPKASTPPAREEIEAYLADVKEAGIMVALNAAPFFLRHILSEASHLQCAEATESVYCWLRKVEPPLCRCGSRRKFNSLPEGYFLTCGRDCSETYAPGNPQLRSKGLATMAARLKIEIVDDTDEAYAAALHELIEQAGKKHYAGVLQHHEPLLRWVQRRSEHLPEDTGWPERVHVALTGESPICPNGKRRRVRRLSEGYLYCGREANCACLAESKGRLVTEGILQAAPAGYITIYEWANAYGLNPSTVNTEFKNGRLPGKQVGRYIFVPLELEPPQQDEKVSCAICGQYFFSITNTHLALHSITFEEYTARYPGPTIGTRAIRKISEVSRAQVRTEIWRENMRQSMLRFMASLPEEIREIRYVSKQEDEFVSYLQQKGLVIGIDILRQHAIIPNVPLLYDVVLPHTNIIVEIDGPQHWLRWIYKCRGGRTPEEMFALQQKTDMIRNTTARNSGFSLFRIRVNQSLNDVEPFQDQLRKQGFPAHLLD